MKIQPDNSDSESVGNMNNKKHSRIFAAIFGFVSICFAVTGCAKGNQTLSAYEKVPISASWAYHYSGIDDLAENSDLIAVITVKDRIADKDNKQYGAMLTKYTVQIDTLIYGEETDRITVIMTGGTDDAEKKIYEISDDPLMENGDTYLIFAKQNEDGTYAILSGSQGRFVIIDDKVYSLNAVNEQVKESNHGSGITVDGTPKEAFFKQIVAALTER